MSISSHLTTAGTNLISSIATGGTLIFTGAKVGSGSGGTTDVAVEKGTGSIIGVTQNDGATTVSVLFRNDRPNQIGTAFQLKEIGIWAKSNLTSEPVMVIYCTLSGDDIIDIPAYSDTQPVSQHSFDLGLYFTSNYRFTITTASDEKFYNYMMKVDRHGGTVLNFVSRQDLTIGTYRDFRTAYENGQLAFVGGVLCWGATPTPLRVVAFTFDEEDGEGNGVLNYVVFENDGTTSDSYVETIVDSSFECTQF